MNIKFYNNIKKIVVKKTMKLLKRLVEVNIQKFSKLLISPMTKNVLLRF